MKKKENHLSTRQNDCDSYTSRSVTTESVLLRTVSVLSYNIIIAVSGIPGLQIQT